MAKRKTPNEKSGSGASATTRIAGDLARMIVLICEMEGISTHELLDPILRPSVTARFDRIKKQIEEIERIKQKTREQLNENRK